MSDTYDDPLVEDDPGAVPSPTLGEAMSGENAWQRYVPMAIRVLYPQLRDGVDYAWGRPDLNTPGAFTYWDEKLQPADEAAIEEEARRMAASDPSSGYVEPETPPA